ncbi:MAG: secondary thiamine-phosphate synthase enzyme YjbQ, partial [Candidatus Hodarchaeales archaeon]
MIQKVITKSKIKNGILNIVCPGATGAITTIEHESGLLEDFPIIMEKLVPKKHSYQHNRRNYDDNGHSHCRAAVIGPSLTLNFKDGRLITGTWQQCVFLEFDTRSRSRHLDIMIIGCK